jgi:hypothetical protein
VKTIIFQLVMFVLTRAVVRIKMLFPQAPRYDESTHFVVLGLFANDCFTVVSATQQA